MSIETDTIATIQATLATALPTTVQRWLPSDAPFAPPQADPWLQLTPLWGMGVLHTMGKAPLGSNLLLCLLSCNVFLTMPLDIAPAYAVADTLRHTLNRAELPGVVRFEVPSPARPLRFDNVYWQLHVDAPFTVLETLGGP